MVEVRAYNVNTGVMVDGLLAVNIGSRLAGYHWARFSSSSDGLPGYGVLLRARGWPPGRSPAGDGAGLHQGCLIQAPEVLEQTVALRANSGLFLSRDWSEGYDRQETFARAGGMA